MQQRDILKDQIDQLGRVLGKMLADFLGLKIQGNVMQGIELANQQLRQKTNISIAELGDMTDAEFLIFIESHPFNSNSLETFGDFLGEVGHYRKDINPDRAKRFFQHAHTAYEQANHRSDEYSMQRASKQEEVSKFLK